MSLREADGRKVYYLTDYYQITFTATQILTSAFVFYYYLTVK